MNVATIDPTAGECVALLGTRDAARATLLRNIAASIQDALLVGPADPLFPGLDVAGNVAFPLRRPETGRAERTRALAETLAMAGLDAVAGRRVNGLTAELRARVLLARAFTSGRALVLDDVFEAVRADERPGLAPVLRGLMRQHRTRVVMATADRTEMLACGDRIGVIESGRIVSLGAIETVLAGPGSAFAAQALLDVALFAGRVDDNSDDRDDADVALACGVTMPARLAESVRPGDLCLVAVRPDQIAFAPVAAAAMGGAAVPATLIDCRHFGDHLRLRVRLDDGGQIHVRRPIGSLGPLDIDRASSPLGACLAWRASHATAYPHPQA
jgi:putative spermidine/putrescine transport system ATP-binding protein